MQDSFPTPDQETHYSDAEILAGRAMSRKAIDMILKESDIEAPAVHEQSTNIIDRVPGVERNDTSPTADETPVSNREEGVKFKGDPRRVIGHPANPTNEMSRVYSEHLNKP